MPVTLPRVWLLSLLASAAPVVGAEITTEKEPFTFNSLLPTAWQKRPQVTLNAITEMTAAGRQKRVPTPESPMYYVTVPGQFKQLGWMVSAGERPPPKESLEEAMQKALAENGYLPTTGESQRPDVLIVFTFGSHGTDPASIAPDTGGSPPVNADEMVAIVLSDVSLFKDVIDRAVLIGGAKFALELKAALDEEIRNMWSNVGMARIGGIPMPVNPDFGSPYQIFIRSGNSELMSHLAELAFHTCYFVVATAYDFTGVEKKEKITLWQTRMTIEAQGVEMSEVLKPLIQNAGVHLGRETPEAAIIRKRIDREGTVSIGTAEVVREPAPVPSPAEGKR